jgi:DNA-binding CsgD family transcriptional regulator
MHAILANSHGNYAYALERCTTFLDAGGPLYLSFVVFELVESVARAGSAEEAARARDLVAGLTSDSVTPWGIGVGALARALLDPDTDTELAFRQSIGAFDRSSLVFYAARVRLLFGEWLRRQGRRRESRGELGTAFDLCSGAGMAAFAERALGELRLTGEVGSKRAERSADDLTPQELQIARMAATGLTNRQIGERMYLSHRTVGSHLYRVYPKLGITSRNQLHIALGRNPDDTRQASAPSP